MLFLSLEAVPDAKGKKQDLSTQETLAEDASIARFSSASTIAAEVSDDEIRRYIHHQDQQHPLRRREQGPWASTAVTSAGAPGWW